MTAPPIDTPFAPSTGGPVVADRWTSAGIAETLPGVQPPLVWCVAAGILSEALRRLLADLASLPADADLDTPLLAQVDGRAMLSADVVDALSPNGARPGRWRRVRHDVRLVRLRRIASCEAETCIVASSTVVAAGMDLAGMDDRRLLAHRRRVLDLAGRSSAAEAGVALAASAAYRHLERSLVARLGESGRAWAQRVTAAGGAGSAAWSGGLAAEVRRAAPPALAAALARAATWDDALVALEGADGAPVVAGLMTSAMRAAGSRAVFGGPTWDEDPALAWPLVHRQLQPPGAEDRPVADDGSWSALTATLRSTPGWRRTRVLTGQVIDVRLHLLARLREDADTQLDRRERSKAAVLALGGEVRRIHLEVGRRLAARGGLADEHDVDLLDERELGPALAGAPPYTDVLDGRRRSPVVGGGSEPAAPPGGPTRFDGVAASPGRLRGPALVVGSADDYDLVAPGDIVVTATTDPSWTPLLLMAGAVVVEAGDLLSHAAVLARELGIPAVVGVPGIVDDAGRVVVLPQEHEETPDGW